MIKTGITTSDGIWLPVTVSKVHRVDDDDDWKDEYRDFDQPDPDEFGTCDTCCNFVRCPFEGHKDIGWCSRYDEFAHATDTDDCWEER